MIPNRPAGAGMFPAMPYATEFDFPRRRAVLRAEGPVDLAASLEAMAALTTDARLGSGYTILVDMRAADYTPSLAEVRRLTDLKGQAEQLKAYPIAFVTSTAVHHTAANMVATMATLKGARAKAFRELAEAEAWLADQPPGAGTTAGGSVS